MLAGADLTLPASEANFAREYSVYTPTAATSNKLILEKATKC